MTLETEGSNHAVNNQQLSAVLMQMSDAEVIWLLNITELLQADLLRLVPVFHSKELVETVTYTQDLLNILNGEIIRVLAINQVQDFRDYLKNLNNGGTRVDYAPVLRLLRKIHSNKRCLIWAGLDGAG